MDYATLVGLVSAFGLLVGAIIMGGNVASFFDLPSVLLVIFGTLATTSIAFSFRELWNAQTVIVRSFFHTSPDQSQEARHLISLAQKTYGTGVLVLQKELAAVSDPFLRHALALAVDGTGPDVLLNIMKTDTLSLQERHQATIQILRKAGELAPAMGLIGTLVGLVQMLSALNDPAAIGPAMAIALITTFYGAVLANMFFLPLAAKLERNSNEELRLRKLYMAGTLSIVKQENPRQLEMLLNTILPPEKRIRVFK